MNRLFPRSGREWIVFAFGAALGIGAVLSFVFEAQL
jgi:hypothetical protein